MGVFIISANDIRLVSVSECARVCRITLNNGYGRCMCIIVLRVVVKGLVDTGGRHVLYT